MSVSSRKKSSRSGLSIAQATRAWIVRSLKSRCSNLAEGEDLNPAFLATLKDPGQKVRDLMSSPVVSVSEDTEAKEIAKLLIEHRIKRVPVVRDGKMVGIVSRADLVRALAG